MPNLAMSAEERKEYASPVSIADDGGPKYPYGLCITLDDGTLEKLGLSEAPKVGTEITFTAKATVSSVSSYEQAEGDSERSVGLQITDMDIAGGGTASKLYE